MKMALTLTPAYGRDYKSKKAVVQDWEDGKDFIRWQSIQQTKCFG
jgi:hypothetical protein